MEDSIIAHENRLHLTKRTSGDRDKYLSAYAVNLRFRYQLMTWETTHRDQTDPTFYRF